MQTVATQQTQSQEQTSSSPGRSKEETQDKKGILRLQRLIGNQAAQRIMRARTEKPTAPCSFDKTAYTIPKIQRKLTISSPGDPFEREADDVADTVMRMTDPAAVTSAPVAIQRKCGECEEQEVQRKGNNDGGTVDSARIHGVLGSGGKPLGQSARDFFEPRFGREFSAVRVHTDTNAERSAEELEARAYTVGQNIVFGSGQFAPDTHDGKHLIAHELAHVVQQSAGVSPSLQRESDGPLDVRNPNKDTTEDTDHEETEEGDEDEPIDDYESGADNEVPPDEGDDDIDTDPEEPLSDNTVARKPIKQPTKGKWILVKLPRTLTRYDGSKKISSWGISAGRPKHPTPTGSFQISYRDENHRSNSYGKCDGTPIGPDGANKCKKKGGKYVGADMHYFQRFAPSVGFHRGDPTALSHGCIHVSGKNAATLWNWSAKGTPVIVQPK